MKILSRDVIVLILFACAAMVALLAGADRLNVDADLVSSFEGSSASYDAFIEHREQFGDDTKDVVVAVQSDAPLILADVENLVIELQLTSGVRDVFSIFSLPARDGSRQSFLDSAGIAELPVRERISMMRETVPFASGLISEDAQLTMLVVVMDPNLDPREYNRVLAAPLADTPGDLVVTRVGTPRLETEINAALVRDQVTITPLAVIFGLALIFLIFRSWRAVVICGLPIIMAISLFLGGMAVTGTAMSPILSLVPVILIVLGFADSIHFFHAICHRAGAQNIVLAVADARRDILPAIIGTTMTTVLAFIVMLIIDSAALTSLALVGSIGMIGMLVVVATMVPVLARLFLTQAVTARTNTMFHMLLGLNVALLQYAKPIGLASIGLLVVLGGAQRHVVTGYDPLEHIPYSSTILDDIAGLQARLPGSGRHYVMVDAAPDGPNQAVENVDRLSRASQAALGVAVTFSQEFIDAPAAQRFIARDGGGFSLPVPTSMIAGPDAIVGEVANLKEQLRAAGVDARVTGYAYLAATQMPVLVDGLRNAFYIAIVVMTVLIAVFLRSLPAAVATLVPNLLPILGIEALMVLTGQTVTITAAVALLVAFGIAVDNTIHIVNRVRLERKRRSSPEDTINHSIAQLISPIMITSILLIVGFALTAFSALPAVSLFGLLTAMAIVIAVLADLLLFPSLLFILLQKDLF